MADRPTASVVDKIALLLNLSRDKGTTTHEAATAAAQAQRLMDRHRLDLAAVDRLHATDHDVSLVADDPLDSVGKPVTWKLTLGAELAALNHCRLVSLPSRRRAGGASLILIGVADDVQVVRHLYTYLTRTIDGAARAAMQVERRVVLGWTRSEATRWGQSFRLGAVAEVLAMMRHARQRERDVASARDHGVALVLLDAHEKRVLAFCDRFVCKDNPYGKPPDGFHQNLDAHLAGRRAARRFALHPPLKEGDGAPKLDSKKA